MSVKNLDRDGKQFAKVLSRVRDLALKEEIRTLERLLDRARDEARRFEARK